MKAGEEGVNSRHGYRYSNQCNDRKERLEEEEEEVNQSSICCLQGCLAATAVGFSFLVALPSGILLVIYATNRDDVPLVSVGAVLILLPLLMLIVVVVLCYNQRRLARLGKNRVTSKLKKIVKASSPSATNIPRMTSSFASSMTSSLSVAPSVTSFTSLAPSLTSHTSLTSSMTRSLNTATSVASHISLTSPMTTGLSPAPPVTSHASLTSPMTMGLSSTPSVTSSSSLSTLSTVTTDDGDGVSETKVEVTNEETWTSRF